jgi:hypothetical protein
LSLPPYDLTQSHALLVSFDELLDGDWDRAGDRVGKINEPTLREWDQYLWQIIRVLNDFYKDRIAGLMLHVEAIDRLIALARTTNFFEGNKLLFTLCRRAALSIANDRKSGWLSALTYLRFSWLTCLSSIQIRR